MTIKLTYKNGNELIQDVEWFKATKEGVEFVNRHQVHSAIGYIVKISWDNLESVYEEHDEKDGKRYDY